MRKATKPMGLERPHCTLGISMERAAQALFPAIMFNVGLELIGYMHARMNE
jgi:hypothetical protein